MEKLGISQTYINFIKILYKDNIYIITNNGFLSEPISLSRVLRQGCPLSLPLHVVQGEVKTTNINKMNSIIGLYTKQKKKQIKISQYADDSNFFLKNQESVKQVLQYFQNLKKATGVTINLEKITLLPINTNNTINIPNDITIMEQYQTTKVLGVLYNEDL